MAQYYTKEVKPTITASKQHAAAFSDNDVLFNWTAFAVPKGTHKLVGVQMTVKPKGDAGPTANTFACDLLFARRDDIRLGVINAAADNRPNPYIIGHVEMAATGYAGGLTSTSICSAGRTPEDALDLVMTPRFENRNLSTQLDGLYVGAIAKGAFDFRTLNRVNETSFAAGTQTVITTDGSSMDIREHFAINDVIHAHDDAVLGTVKSADATTQITLSAANTAAIADDDYLFDVNPVRLLLQFELGR